MRLAREFPPNPHAIVYHAAEPLTEAIVETYLGDRSGPRTERPWVARVLSVDGVRVLSICAHKVRVQKLKALAWSELLPSLEEVLEEELSGGPIEDLLETECRRRAFSWYGPALDRLVLEGLGAARVHPLAARLFELRGVVEVILDGNCVEIGKCPLYSWADLTAAIQGALDRGHDELC
jgi:hypothetical protein